MTDESGNFVLDDIPLNTVLIATNIGMVSEEVTYTGQKELNIVLKFKASELDEVTIVAFGTQKKESVIGSITTVKQSELRVPSSNLTTAFAGRVAGLISYQQSGEPGRDNASFLIRGITNFGEAEQRDEWIESE